MICLHASFASSWQSVYACLQVWEAIIDHVYGADIVRIHM